MIQIGAICLAIGGVLGFLGGWMIQDDRVQAKELALLMVQGMQREAENQADARVKASQDQTDAAYQAMRDSYDRRQKDLNALNAQLDEVASRNRVALSAATLRLLNADADSRKAKANRDPGQAPANPAAAEPATGRYFAASELTIGRWVTYAMSGHEELREQLGALVAIVCSRPDVFRIVAVEYPFSNPCKPE